jgi:hypothetical protein
VLNRILSRQMLFGIGLLLIGAPAQSAEDDGLVVTELADPDPTFVPPPEPKATQLLQLVQPQPSSRFAVENARAEERSRAEMAKAERTICNTLRVARDSGIPHPEWEKRCGF